MKRLLTSPRFGFPVIGMALIAGAILNFGQAPAVEWPEKFVTYEDASRFLAAHYEPETWAPERSQAIAKAEYFPEAQVLAVYFKGKPDKGYLYENVPGDLWTRFKAAESPGGFYNQNIRGNRAFFFFLSR